METMTLVEKIDQWALRTPETLCFKDGSDSYTYAQLKHDSDALAAFFEKEYANQAPIIVYGGLEYEMIVSFLACSKAGHAYIPIDSHTPAERVSLIAEVADYAAVIAWADWPLTNAVNLLTAEQALEKMALAVKPTGKGVVGDDNYYLIFTSGTTGVPKGVQISHDNLTSYTDWMRQDFGIKDGQVFLSQAPYSFDLSVMDVYPALLSGGQLAPLKKAVINDFKTLFTELPQMAVNVWVSTPSFVDICLMDPRFNGEENLTITHFLFCGEELAHSTASKLLERFPKARIYNTYGPTEATVAVTQIEITPDVLSTYSRLPIGRVKSDTTIYIMDESGQPLPEGEVGEIVIVGPSVSKGYYRNPEKTAEAFYLMNGCQAYKTGDAGLLDEGLLFYKGRMDFQIKLHGYRIELEDIDHHLSEVSYVKAAAVVPKYVEHKVQQLVAYIVPEAHSFEKAYQLSKAIKEELKLTVMDYMIPQKYIYVEALPLTQNGKVDRKGLINEVNES